MIPKVIHYCWFGGKELPPLANKCIASWRKFCPDYEIRRWDEDTFDLFSAPLYVRQAYEAKKFAFVTDYVRLFAMYTQGGIYMDTDVELTANLDKFLIHRGFSGFETNQQVSTAIMASECYFPLLQTILNHYAQCPFLRNDGTPDLTTNVVIITRILTDKGFIPNNTFQEVEGFALYPKDFFCPYDNATGVLRQTANTAAIHWFSKSWVPLGLRLRSQITRPLHRLFGTDCFAWLKRK